MCFSICLSYGEVNYICHQGQHDVSSKDIWTKYINKSKYISFTDILCQDILSSDTYTVDKMYVNEISVDEMSLDEMSVDEMSVDEMSVD